MTLYALKCGKGYLRISETDGFRLVEMDKASVYPPEKISTLKEFLSQIVESGFGDARIVELIVTENCDFSN